MVNTEATKTSEANPMGVGERGIRGGRAKYKTLWGATFEGESGWRGLYLPALRRRKEKGRI